MRIPTIDKARSPIRTRAHGVSSVRALSLLGGTILLGTLVAPAQAQLLRGSIGTTGNGVLGTGLTVNTSAPGSGILGTGLNVGTTGSSILGTGVTVGTTNPGNGILGTGLTVGTSSGGALGTGILVGTTGPGDGLLGTGLRLGTAGNGSADPGGGCTGCGTGGSGGQGVYIVTGNVTQSQSQFIVSDLRLSDLSSVAAISTNNTSGLAAPTATGGDAIAVGYGANAPGAAATALGTGATASATASVAVGYGAAAQGVGSTAVGTASAASGNGSTALGFAAAAGGTGSTALGATASAAGDNSVALGTGAAANQTNAIAIGAGVRTTQANQVAIGNAANTYTLPGIASQASAAAQSGETRFVTSDAGGNLATSAYGPSSIASLGNRVDSVEGRVGSLEARTAAMQRYAVETRKEARQGVAMAIAMGTAPMPSAPGRTTWASNASTYRGEWGGGLAVAHRLQTCCVPIAITAGVGYGGSNSLGARAGLAGEF